MRLLLTGGTGYLGTNFASKCKGKHEIISLSRRYISDSEGIMNKRCDLSKTDDLKQLLQNLDEIDGIILFGTMTDMKMCEENRNAALDTNVKSTLEIMEFARSKGIKKIIYVSTGSVYKKTDDWINEDTDTEADNFYELTKIMAEDICKYYSIDARVSIVRPFFPYGPNTHPKRLINTLINKIDSGQEVILNTGDKPLVTPIYVDDISDSLMELIKFQGSGFDIFNLCGPRRISIREIATIIGKCLDIEPIFKETDGKASNFAAKSSKIERVIQLTSFEDGVMKTIRLIKS